MTLAPLSSDLESLQQSIVGIQKKLVSSQELLLTQERDFQKKSTASLVQLIELLDLTELLQKEDSSPYFKKIEKRVVMILKSHDVTEITQETVAPGLVKVLETQSNSAFENGKILEIVRRGFIRGTQVLRPMEVISNVR